MWRDICLANREALLAALDDYLEELELLRGMIEASDGEGWRRGSPRPARRARKAGEEIDIMALTYQVAPGGALTGRIRVRAINRFPTAASCSARSPRA